MALADDLRVIDTDTHVTEPPDLWTSRLSSKWGDLRPRVAYNADWGMDCWLVGNRWLNPVGYYNYAGWHEHPPAFPPDLARSDAAGFDPAERLRRMDEFGLYAQVLYPNVIGFETQSFLEIGDPGLALECVRAYNDFLTDFASADPRRLLPISMLPYWDVEASIAEMERCRENGHRGVLWAAKLHALGYPRINSGHWDDVYAAAQDLEMSLNLHIGIGAFTNDDLKFRELNREDFKLTAYIADTASSFTSNIQTISTLLASDTFDRFPRLQAVSVESGWGYLPFLMEALDWQWKNSAGPTLYPHRRLPSEKFFSNMYGTFWFERRTLEYLALHPEYADRVMFETDFPHPTSLAPGPASTARTPREMIEDAFRDVPREIAAKVLHGNAARLYHVA
ncbi:amidohydrolase family protein [Pseudofrankia inefficax]|uniref:Amidohydrolase 2 n=1 Tax=Pseudofrankia inefficax (strain DSM 45817 / CECT 9037 / DDB 130130 / EuI1c) TaxID=298654 RepID=E3IU43_PSEI1|nr:amidohydrolase family protein [Pseudofrankia inefficax]ADP81236.1 amidohydrolase 2 [Pseudofrankia inefficax]